MSNIDRAAETIYRTLNGQYGDFNYPTDAAQALADADLLTPAPQIIRTPAELEALDPDALLMTQDGNIFYAAAKGRLFEHDLPAVVVASGEHVRACREALEGGTT
ncbi:MAG: hypothetical protein ACI38U_14220 [Corynebacterium sp.]|jgi:hypothetical protein|uniref:hypothetical protein n=1 Tax=Corynebacterium sp. TaxID=1720 RepID=UPI003F0B025E